MKVLSITDFEDYFRELHDHKPYFWQQRLAEQAITGIWPRAIDLPTGAGKTACIDIAIFALACQMSQQNISRSAPVRVFFCVNRRVIVDAAYQRSRNIAAKLWVAERDEEANTPVLREVARVLRRLTQAATRDAVPPLDVLELRGGVYRDNRWARSATQPTVVCTTIDQLGSRLLFRGYGVSGNAAPIQAALIAYDSLILLDEAHISRPFHQTLASVQQYLDPHKWADCAIGMRPVVIVPMTATPPEDIRNDDLIRIAAKDRENRLLDNRLTASKPATLKSVPNIVSATVTAAADLARDEPRAVGVILNRVPTARSVYMLLREQYPDAIVELVIGSMRPIDRDRQAERLRAIVGTARPEKSRQTSFIVATQCLEVGADYDFDDLVTECASMDALRQRFGRLNRAGRPISAQAVILVEKGSIKPDDRLKNDKPADPIYGNSLARTWNWLSRLAADRTVDLGIDALDGLLKRHFEDGCIPVGYLAPSAQYNAPAMLPIYIDYWCQTSPRPAPDPDVSLFVHGNQRHEADVQVCWRSDLVRDRDMDPDKHWCDVVALLPPTMAECMTVPLSRILGWLTAKEANDNDADLLDIAAPKEKDAGAKDSTESELRPRGVVWRGPKDSMILRSARDVRPGDTVVIPESDGGWDELGTIACAGKRGEEGLSAAQRDVAVAGAPISQIDIAEAAFEAMRNRAALRIHPSLRSHAAVQELLDLAAGPNFPVSPAEWRSLLIAVQALLPDQAPNVKATLSRLVDSGFICEAYPDERGVVLISRSQSGIQSDAFLPSLDEGDDSPSRIHRSWPVSLEIHTRHVLDTLNATLPLLQLTSVADSLQDAASLHDLGKADERFQAMLRRTDRTDAWLSTGITSLVLAKSDGLPQTPAQQRAARRQAGLPDGFRHEMLSVQLGEKTSGPKDDAVVRDLVHHLIAAHHGYGRPWAPVVDDDDPPDVEIQGVSMDQKERLACPPHHIDSGIAERFWALTRRYGWWGLAYLESVLRLADQQASVAEDSGVLNDSAGGASVETTR